MKGQTDLFGLLLIVLVLLFVGVIILGILARSGERENQSFLSTKANTMVNALVKATACERTLEDAMIACCEDQPFCGRDACEFVSSSVSRVIDESGEAMGFSLTDGQGCELTVGVCSYGISSSGFLLKTETGVYTAKVTMCTDE